MITLIYNNLIWYEYKGDEIAWTGSVYVSVATGGGSFMSLQEMDDFWLEYEKEMRNSYGREKLSF